MHGKMKFACVLVACIFNVYADASLAWQDNIGNFTIMKDTFKYWNLFRDDSNGLWCDSVGLNGTFGRFARCGHGDKPLAVRDKVESVRRKVENALGRVEAVEGDGLNVETRSEWGFVKLDNTTLDVVPREEASDGVVVGDVAFRDEDVVESVEGLVYVGAT